MKVLNAGLVGFGVSAKTFHAPFLVTSDQYKLVAVVERNKEDSKEKYPFVKLYRTFDELIHDPVIDIVIITTPNDTHFPYSKAALEAGKHVIVEKPFTNTSEEARQLVEISRNSATILSIYQNRRYVSDFFTIKEILGKELLGKVHTFEGHYDRYRAEARPDAWREKSLPGSGILYDLGAHLIDQAQVLFGLPHNITADIRMQRPHARVDDYFDLRLDYGFLQVILKAGMLVREPGPRYIIHGTEGSFVKFGEDPQEARLRAGELPVGDNWGKEPEEWHGLLHTIINGKTIRKNYPSHSGNYGLYYKSVYDTIVHQAPLSEKPEHGYNTIRLIELAFESHYQQRTISCSNLMPVK